MARARFLLTEALREVLRRHSLTPTMAARNAGLYEDLLTASFRGARCLSLDEIERVLDANNIPFEELWAYVNSACQLPPQCLDPVALVAGMRETPFPCYHDLRIWLTWAPTIGSGDAPLNLPDFVKDVETIRARDPEEALECARIWVSTFKNRLKGASQGRPFRSSAVCDFAIALGLWGSVACCLGLANDAAFALEHALRLHSKFPLSVGYARLLLWSTSLALPAGDPSRGIFLAERALISLTCINEKGDHLTALVILANMTAHSGDLYRAGQIADTILAHPGIGVDSQFAALILKVKAALHANQLPSAQEGLEKAKKLLPLLSANREAKWIWYRGRLAAARQDIKSATEYFCQLLMKDHATFQPGDKFLAFLDLAEILRDSGDFNTIRTEARKLSKWIPLLVSV